MDKTNEEKKAIAEGWRDSGLRQSDYAAQHGISDRTLRLWVAKYAPPPPRHSSQILHALCNTIEQLNRLYTSMGIDMLGPVRPPPILDTRPAPVPRDL